MEFSLLYLSPTGNYYAPVISEFCSHGDYSIDDDVGNEQDLLIWKRNQLKTTRCEN